MEPPPQMLPPISAAEALELVVIRVLAGLKNHPCSREPCMCSLRSSEMHIDISDAIVKRAIAH